MGEWSAQVFTLSPLFIKYDGVRMLDSEGGKDVSVKSSYFQGQYYHKYIHDILTLNTKERQNLIYSRKFYILYVLYANKWYSKEKIHEHAPTARNIYILFHEQTVCRRGTK